MKMNNSELATRIFDCLSDGYDDEEEREHAEIKLYERLSEIENDDILRHAIIQLCERVEELLD